MGHIRPKPLRPSSQNGVYDRREVTDAFPFLLQHPKGSQRYRLLQSGQHPLESFPLPSSPT